MDEKCFTACDTVTGKLSHGKNEDCTNKKQIVPKECN